MSAHHSSPLAASGPITPADNPQSPPSAFGTESTLQHRASTGGMTEAHVERACDALADFVAMGKHLEPGGPSAGLFRGFVKRAKAPAVHGRGNKSTEEHMADDLLTIRRQNERRARCGEPLRPEPAWAADIDAMFPDGRTHPNGVAA